MLFTFFPTDVPLYGVLHVNSDHTHHTSMPTMPITIVMSVMPIATLDSTFMRKRLTLHTLALYQALSVST